MRKKTTEDFIAKAREVHGDRYDYSKSNYKAAKLPITIICKQHGEFQQVPYSHYAGNGCPKCGSLKAQENTRYTVEEFVSKARALWGDKYDYSQVRYVNFDTKVTIVCPKHGAFEQTPGKHLQSETGCGACGRELQSRRKMMNAASEFINKAKKVHGDRYDYSLVDYTGVFNNVKILCHKHGVFEQTPDNHIHNHGCPSCHREWLSESLTLTHDEFLKRAVAAHGDRYDYSLVEYSRGDSKVKIICKEHGVFEQTPSSHFTGTGCPSCGYIDSKAERELFEFVLELCPTAERSNRVLLNGLELDILVLDKNIAIEFNGIYYHSEAHRPGISETRHSTKTKLCEALGLRLIHIYEDDWTFNQEVVKHTLRHIFGVATRRSYARNYEIVDLPHEQASAFLKRYHMQGSSSGGRNLALVKDGEVVSVMTLSKVSSERGVSDPNRYELKRFASSHSVVGAASKLFKYFLKTTEGIEDVISYSDNDMFTGDVYPLLGFKFDRNVAPDYKIVRGRRRYHKSRFRRSELEKMFPTTFDPNLSEHQNCLNHRLYRIYNSGLKRWRFTP